MPYLESEHRMKIRKARNNSEPVFEGSPSKIAYFEVKQDDFYWLMEQAEKVEKLEKRIGELSEDICPDCGKRDTWCVCNFN